MNQTWDIAIQGRVQGVGFRPFVYGLAQRLGLAGEVRNSPSGVLIRATGPKKRLAQFVERLQTEAPKPSRIESLAYEPSEWVPFAGFRIAASQTEGFADLALCPDLALCAECRRELYCGGSRRYRYPFVSCTYCGPRLSIVEGLPFDRSRTTMRAFELCANCRSEYNDPDDRRFHAQTNSCRQCAIPVRLLGPRGAPLATADEALHQTVQRLRLGEIVAVKGIGGFLLLVDAHNPVAVRRLRRLKPRPEKPLALMLPSLDELDEKQLSAPQRVWLESAEAPIVLLPGTAFRRLDAECCAAIAPHLDEIGAMLPYAPLLDLLLHDLGHAVVATSANPTGAPVLYDASQVHTHLHEVVDAVLTHQRPIALPQDDSVLRLSEEGPVWLRRGRGLAPETGLFFAGQDGLLCLGAELKGSFTLVVRGRTLTSPFLGDLAEWDAQQRYTAMLQRFQGLYHFEPSRIVHDLHPDFFTTRLAQTLESAYGAERYAVQHHEAHLAAVLAEHDAQPVSAPSTLGVVWDGFGLGKDGAVWGSEFFLVSPHGFERQRPALRFSQVAGDQLARRPGWALQALLLSAGLPPERYGLADAHTPVLAQLAPRAKLSNHSMGRLFDAVASLLLGVSEQAYEGHAALRLEQLARRASLPAQGAVLPENLEAEDADWMPRLLEALLEGRRAGKAPETLALFFHRALVDLVAYRARRYAAEQIAFSGGVFQNALLVDLLRQRLGRRFRLLFHRRLPANDEGVSAGQAAWLRFFLDNA